MDEQILNIDKIVQHWIKSSDVKSKQKHAPFRHNLYRLAGLSGIDSGNEYADYFDKITTFNLNSRYDDYLKIFENECTNSFSEYWVDKIDMLRKWIKTMF